MREGRKKRNLFFLFVGFAILFLFPTVKTIAKEDFALSARVDVKIERDRAVAIDVLTNQTGTVYGYRVQAGKAAPDLATVLKGDKQAVKAGVENTLLMNSYSLQCECGEKYDFYLAFVDASGNKYGLYSILNKEISNFPAGDGTLNNPYQIWTDRHFYNLYACTGDKDIHVKIMQNIDMSNSEYKGSMTGYASTFYGTLDGNSKVIRGMNGRLFDGIGESGLVHDLYFYQCDADGYFAIVAISNAGTIKSCSLQACTVTKGDSTYDVGGFAASNKGTIRRCEVRNVVLKGGFDFVGGIAGSNSGTIDTCYAEVTASSTWDVGGIVGSNRDSGKIYGCLSNPVSLYCSNGSKGGIAGSNNASNGLITGCISTYLPVNPEKAGDGSIVGLGGNASTAACIGALTTIPVPPADSEDETAMREYSEMLASYMERNGAIMVPYHFDNPITEYIAINFTNVAEFTGIHFAYQKAYVNETSGYQKVSPLKELALPGTASKSKPGKVTISKVKKKSSTSVALTWKAVTGASGYQVYYSTKKSSGYKKAKKVKAVKTTITGLKKGKYYYIKVRAYSISNGKKVYGTFSKVKSVHLV